MDAKLFLVLLLFGTIALGYGDDRAQIPYFSCSDFENTTALNLTEVSEFRQILYTILYIYLLIVDVRLLVRDGSYTQN